MIVRIESAIQRATLHHERHKATASAPVSVPCRRCRQARPPTYYPWIPGTATRGVTCNSCLRMIVGRPRKHAPIAPKLRPMGPSARARYAARTAYWEAQRGAPLPPGLTSTRARQIALWLAGRGIPGHTARTVWQACRGAASVRAVWPDCSV